MTSKIDGELKERLAVVLAEGVSPEALKGINKMVESIRDDIESDVMYRLKDDLAPNLAAWCADMAERAVTSLLEGNEDQMRRYLSCEKRGEDGQYVGWTGRSDPIGYYHRNIEDQHPIIHGKLFEQGCVALRKSIVDAHRDTLVTERILDLEDQVKSLVAQFNKITAEKQALVERYREY